MMLTSRQRWMLYAAGLAVAISATVWVERGDNDAPVLASARAHVDAAPPDASRQAAQQHTDLAIDGLPVRKHGGADGDPFSPRSWKQMAAQEAMRDAPRRPPPAPVPPPLPFSYMGKLIEGKKTTVFLTSDDERNYVARVGETIDGNYRVEEIGEHRMVLTYLPLKHRQEVTFETDIVPAATRLSSRGGNLPDDDADALERSNVDAAARPSLVERAPRANTVNNEEDE